jgi:hypothetical protein
MKPRISVLTIGVDDLDRSVSFYLSVISSQSFLLNTKN